MPKYNNSIKRPEHVEVDIVDKDEHAVGTVRVKPSSVLWKRSGSSKFYVVPLDRFRQWIEDPGTKAKRASK